MCIGKAARLYLIMCIDKAARLYLIMCIGKAARLYLIICIGKATRLYLIISIGKAARPGLENCTHPLVFTSGSSVRASGNCHLLARLDE